MSRISRLYRRVLLTQRTVLAGDSVGVAKGRQWTRERFSSTTDINALEGDMDSLCTFLLHNVVQLVSDDGNSGQQQQQPLYRLQWRDGLEMNYSRGNVVSSCDCCKVK